jgi:hypothetical protein
MLLGVVCAAPPEGDAPVCRCFLGAKPSDLKTVPDTGVEELDKRLATERDFLVKLFGVDAQIVVLADGSPRPVFATPKSVAFARDWLKLRWKSGDSRAAVVAFALAHQWAHVLQEQRGLKLQGIAREHHADLLAGWFLGRRNLSTLGGGPELDPTFTTALFAAQDPFANERFEHGRPIDRAEVVQNGFRLFRKDKLTLDTMLAEGHKHCPPAEIGMADDLAAPPEGGHVAVKVECMHKGPCHHRAPCRHQGPCVHKVPCKHKVPCVHEIPCTHRVQCKHEVECKHRVKCKHRIPCVHKIPCSHTIPCNHLDADGNPIHAYHFQHSYDTEHAYDYEHDYDLAHKFDRAHSYDLAHDHDFKHKFDPEHEFDLAHEWDPVHEYDPAHEGDPLHAYDIRYVPEEQAEEASGAK